MSLYLAYETAVEAICYLRTREHDRVDWRKPSRKRSISDAIHTWRELKELEEELAQAHALEMPSEKDGDDLPDDFDSLFYLDELTDLTEPESTADESEEEPGSILDHLTRPLHILVPTAEQNTQTATLMPHVWSSPVPHRAFLEIEPGVFLSTPAFTFLQMATELQPIELIQLGMEFCGFYSPGPSFGRSKASGNLDAPLTELHRAMVASASVFEIDPVCTAKALERFADRAKNLRGSKAAQAALKMVRDNAASHMETALYLLLCLPVRMGGYGLPKPVLNPKVVVEEASGNRTCFPDLYWRGRSIDVEYNSDAEHSGPSAHYRDSKRMVAIVCNRIAYLSITTGQLYRAGDLDNAARGLARLLKHRIRNADGEWKVARMKLRAAVLPPSDRYA